MSGRLDAAALGQALAELEGWHHDAEIGALVRNFRFRDFSEAFGFLSRVALAAEAAGHHPDWSNSYNRVEVRLTTHEAGGVTDKDVALARAIAALAA